MINLANAVYRENAFPEFGADRGHAAIVWKFVGPLTQDNLNWDDYFLIIEMDGPTDNRTLTTITDFTDEWGVHYNGWGCFTNPSITFVQRLKVLQAAKALVARAAGIAWCPYNVLLPENWPGGLHTVTHLRCDGLVELCYEINGVNVWGMAGRPPDGGVHYDITDPSDNWDYNPVTGGWSAGSDGEFDNLEEHNDYDAGGAPTWSDTLVPATQCGHVTPDDADTRFGQQDLCIPVGSKGGNQ